MHSRSAVIGSFLVLLAAHTASAVDIGWANLQWPPMIANATIGQPTDTIYGQVWIDGVTSTPGATAGLIAQAGYGPDGTQPDGSWTWFNLAFNIDVGNNDEFSGSLVPSQLGTFDYATRYSTDGGTTWLLADLNGPQPDNALDNPGHLTVTIVPEPAAATMLALAGTTLLARRSRRA